MSQERRGLMSACEYAIRNLQDIKRAFLDIGNPSHETYWAVGGVIVTLASNLLAISQEVIGDPSKTETPNAVEDLKAIQAKFNQLIDQMIGSSVN